MGVRGWVLGKSCSKVATIACQGGQQLGGEAAFSVGHRQ